MARSTKTAKTGGRISIIDFWRFFVSIMIVFRHTHLIGFFRIESHFYVEFFFILAGYFIFKHFQKPNFFRLNPSQKIKNAIQYTWQRYLKMLAYTIPVVAVSAIAYGVIFYIMRHYWLFDTKYILNIIIEPFMLPAQASPLGTRTISPLWYLSVMFFTMPAIVYIAQSKKCKDWLVFLMIPVSWIYIAVAADIHKNNDIISAVYIIRGVVPMLMGGALFYLASNIKPDSYTKRARILFTVLEFLAYFASAAIALLGYWPSSAIIVLTFLALLLSLSRLSLTTEINSKLWSFLGAISLPLFMWHFGVIRVVKIFNSWGVNRRMFVVIAGSIVISIIHYLIVQCVAAKKNNALKLSSDKKSR